MTRESCAVLFMLHRDHISFLTHIMLWLGLSFLPRESEHHQYGKVHSGLFEVQVLSTPEYPPKCRVIKHNTTTRIDDTIGKDNGRTQLAGNAKLTTLVVLV